MVVVYKCEPLIKTLAADSRGICYVLESTVLLVMEKDDTVWKA